MKGVILAGGLGTRLHPLTRITNKHLLPVYNRPMIFFPIQTLTQAGIDDILIVTGGKHAGDFLELLGNGQEFGLTHLNYAYQEGEGGIADALKLAEHFAEGEKICVILADNVFESSLKSAVEAFQAQQAGARIMLKKVSDPHRFGVVKFEGDKVVEIQEKPASPPSSYAVTGIYFYDSQVFEICKSLKPSARGELEISDVNNHYLKAGKLAWDVLEGWWADCGTFESLLRASRLVAEKESR